MSCVVGAHSNARSRCCNDCVLILHGPWQQLAPVVRRDCCGHEAGEWPRDPPPPRSGLRAHLRVQRLARPRPVCGWAAHVAKSSRSRSNDSTSSVADRASPSSASQPTRMAALTSRAAPSASSADIARNSSSSTVSAPAAARQVQRRLPHDVRLGGGTELAEHLRERRPSRKRQPVLVHSVDDGRYHRGHVPDL